MFLKRFKMWHVMLAISAGLLMSPLALQGQEADEEEFDRRPPPGRERPARGRMRNPEQIERRIDYIREQLDRLRREDPDHPEIQHLEGRLAQLEKIQERMRHRRSMSGREGRRPEGRFEGPQRFSDAEIEEFLRDHEDLAQLFKAEKGKRGAKGGRGLHKRHKRQISEIMTAFEQGDEELAHLMVESAKIQFRIGGVSREFRQVAEGSTERSALRNELADLVREQVEIDLHIRERELQQLRERLANQEAKLAKDWERTDQIATKKLERLLSRKPKGERRRDRERPHRRRPRPDDVDPDQLEE